MKTAHRHLRHLMNPQQQSPGLSSIIVPVSPTPPTLPNDPPTTDPVTYRTVHDSAEIEQLLLTRNALHYSQAKETPFGQEPHHTLLGSDGTSDLSQAILEGTYRHLLGQDSLSPETYMMLDQLKRTELPPI